MQCLVKEPVQGVEGEELRLGIASWDNGSGTAKSIKYTWFDRLDRAARGGEVPVAALKQMIEFATREGYI